MPEVLLNKKGTDPRALSEALAFINDGEFRTFGDYMRGWLKERMTMWGPYLSEHKAKDGRAMPPVDPKLWPTMICAFENQLSVSPRLRGRDYESAIFETTTRSDIQFPVKVSLPIVRDVFPLMFMNRVCGLQPMPPQSGGTMNIFYKKTYRTDVSPTTALTTTDSDYPSGSEGSVPKRLNTVITKETVTAQKFILNATYTQEVLEDLAGAHGINLEREMLDDMSGEILRCIEQIVLKEMYDNASAGTVTWSWTKPETETGYGVTEYYQTLYHAFIDAERLVRAARHRECNYIVAGLGVVTYLKKSNWFTLDPSSAAQGPISSGVRREGRFGLWDVYSTPYISDNTSFISYYPLSMTHAGYIFCPYIPLMPMPRVYGSMKAYDDETMPGAYTNEDTWNQNVRTRFGKKMVQADMFAKVNIQEAAVE